MIYEETVASVTIALDLHGGGEGNHDLGSSQFMQQSAVDLIDRILELRVGQAFRNQVTFDDALQLTLRISG